MASRQLKTEMNSYGNQADDKKYRRPTCRPGAWKGEIMHTDQPFPRKSTTGKKWTRFKSGVQWVLEAGLGSSVPTAELRRIAGLGVNVTDVYRDARCYLKGFFNAIEAFRPDRDANGCSRFDPVRHSGESLTTHMAELLCVSSDLTEE